MQNIVKRGLIAAFFLGVLFLLGCTPVCNAPYIAVGSECCLDRNYNDVCDEDEADKEFVNQNACPDSCDDNNPCTDHACSAETNYQCKVIPITPCCGNKDPAEEGESTTSCPDDCGPSITFEITRIHSDKTKIEKIDFYATNNLKKTFTSLACDYELHNKHGKVSRRQGFYLASDNKLSSSTLGSLLPGQKRQYSVLPYEEMFVEGPYKLLIFCLNETYEFALEMIESCDDGVQNQEEEGVDSGGPCEPCKYKIEEVFELDGIEFQVVSVLVERTVGDDTYSFTMETAAGNYWIVQLIMKNVGKKPRTLYPTEFVVYDSDKRVYDHDEEAEFVYDEYDNGVQFEFSEKLSPTFETRGHLIFDLPRNVNEPLLRVRAADEGNIKYVKLYE